MKKAILVGVIAALMTGCAANTQQYRASSWDASQVNTQQEAQVVRIISIMPATVYVDNTANKEAAALGGALIGGIAGGLVGKKSSSKYGTGVGVGAGTAVGAAAGSALTESKTAAEGVNLGYQKDGKIYTSTQVGMQCEYKTGTALMVSMKSGETRIQPNAECPVQVK